MFYFFLLFCSAESIYTIAVNDVPPFASCSLIFSGYEVDLLRMALNLYGWREEEQFTFQCASNITHYSATVGRVTLNSYNYANGYSYSYPTHNGQLGILVYSNTAASSYRYLSIFSGKLWLTVPAVSFLVLLTLSFIEYVPYNKLSQFMKNEKVIAWVSMSSVFFGEQEHSYRLPSKILMVGYFCFMLMVFSLYMAGNLLQTLSNVQVINFPEKLEGMKFTTYAPYLDYVSIYGGIYVDTGADSSTIYNIVTDLDSGFLDAIVMEYETLMNIAENNCQYAVPSQPFGSFLYAVEIEPGVDSELKTAIDSGLALLVRSFDVDGLKLTYFYTGGACNTQLNTVVPVAMFDLYEVFAGYALGVMGIFFFKGMFTKRELVKERNKHIEEIRELVARPESKIVKVTQNQLVNIHKQFNSIFTDLEKSFKKNSALQEKMLTLIRTKEIKLH
jgi:hypothetical protein